MDGFWMQVEWIQQKVGLQEEDGGGGIDLLPQGEEPAGCQGGPPTRGDVAGAGQEPEKEGALPHIWTGAVSSSPISLPHP